MFMKKLILTTALTVSLGAVAAKRNTTVEVVSDCFTEQAKTEKGFHAASLESEATYFVRNHKYLKKVKGFSFKRKYELFNLDARDEETGTFSLGRQLKDGPNGSEFTKDEVQEYIVQRIAARKCDAQVLGTTVTESKYAKQTCRASFKEVKPFSQGKEGTKDLVYSAKSFTCRKVTTCKMTEAQANAYYEAQDLEEDFEFPADCQKLLK